MPPLEDRQPEEYKSTPGLALWVTDEDKGIVEHIITVFGIADEGDPPDVSHPGCFKKTLLERADRIKVLDAHQARSLGNIIAVPLQLKEVSRAELPKETRDEFPDATGGLWAETQFLLDTPEGYGAFSRIKSGAVTEFSFGFDTIKAERGKKKVDGREITVRNLRELRLWEYSPVLWGKNQATSVIDVKSEDVVVGPLGSADPPCDDNAGPGNGGAAALNPRVPLAPSDLEAWYLPFEVKAVWTCKYLYNLPDSAFLFIEGGGAKDVNDMTEPRYLRHLAIKDANGNLDLPHVRNALHHAPRIQLHGTGDGDESLITKAAAEALQTKAKALLEEYGPSEEKPVDVTANTIRIRVAPAGSKCQKGTFRTITVGKASKGIKALICKNKGEKTTSIQTFIFDKSKWTTTRARAWVKKNSAKSVNLTKLLVDVREAFLETFSGDYGLGGHWVSEVCDDYLVAYQYSRFGGKKYFKVLYTLEDDEIDFAASDEWKQGDYAFTLIEDKGNAPEEQAALARAGEEAARRADLNLKTIEWETLDIVAVLAD